MTTCQLAALLVVGLAAAVTTGCAAVPLDVDVKTSAGVEAEEAAWTGGTPPKVTARLAIECSWHARTTAANSPTEGTTR